MMNVRRTWIAVAVALAAVLPVAAEEQASPPVTDIGIDRGALPVSIDAVDGVRPLFRDGRVYIAGQPSREALAQLHGLGVTAVVNLRTPAEMEDRQRVPYDEAAAVAELGMEYVRIPLGGDEHPYAPPAVDRLAKVLAEHRGPVLLHCTFGWRASYLWVAYLIREQGLALPDALARGEAIAISPDPLEGLLGRPLAVVYEGEPNP
jgi:uncharacterized protein (TIGR01244 family)